MDDEARRAARRERAAKRRAAEGNSPKVKSKVKLKVKNVGPIAPPAKRRKMTFTITIKSEVLDAINSADARSMIHDGVRAAMGFEQTHGRMITYAIKVVSNDGK